MSQPASPPPIGCGLIRENARLPRDRRSRVLRRYQHQLRAIDAAFAASQVAECSIKCSGHNGMPARHAHDPDDGCRNDGTGCLCWCHDQHPGPETSHA